MLVSCSDRGQGLFSSREKAKSLIIYTATLDHPLNFSWVYLQSVHFQPGWVSPNSVSIYKACSLRVRSSTDPALDSQWCEGLEVERAEQSRHGRSICAVIRTLVLTLAFSLFLEHQNHLTTDKFTGTERFDGWFRFLSTGVVLLFESLFVSFFTTMVK